MDVSAVKNTLKCRRTPVVGVPAGLLEDAPKEETANNPPNYVQLKLHETVRTNAAMYLHMVIAMACSEAFLNG